MKSLAKCFAFGMGAFAAALAIGEALNLAMALGAKGLDEPLCDGDFRDMECIEDDGFITCHFSGPIRAI